jgi:hypothetical protein
MDDYLPALSAIVPGVGGRNVVGPQASVILKVVHYRDLPYPGTVIPWDQLVPSIEALNDVAAYEGCTDIHELIGFLDFLRQFRMGVVCSQVKRFPMNQAASCA